jgi:hypothetical protein
VTDQPYDEREDEREAQDAAHEEEPADPLLNEPARDDEPDSLDGR